MLTEKEKSILDQAFAAGNIKQLSLKKAERIAAKKKIPLRAVEWFALDKGVAPFRYQRNIGSLGIRGQKKLLESKVVVVGLGGLGGYVAEELARAGVGHITGVDHDVFDETNLNRQLLAEERNLGKKKTAETQTRLKRINKAVKFTGFAVPINELRQDVVRDADLVFDCLDNIGDRLVLEKKCSAADVPLVHGAIAGWCGEVGVVWPGTRMLEKIYKRKRKGIERNLGTPPFTAATAASLMVAKGIKILTGKNKGKEQSMLFFDLLEEQWQTVTF